MELTLSVLDPGCVPVSKLPDAQKVSENDLFLIARQNINTEITDQELDRILFDEYGITQDDPNIAEARQALKLVCNEGWRLSYSNLSASLLNDISVRFGFNSMAYKEDYEYSLKNHDHPYSIAHVFPALTYAEVSAMYSDKQECTGPYEIPEYLGTVEIYKKDETGQYLPTSSDIYSYHIEFPKYQDPDIGEVRFLAIPQLPASTGVNPRLVSVYSENDMFYDSENDGYWIYPNGQTIKCPVDEFQAACSVYGQSKQTTDTSFTVPKITNFIKPYTNASISSALSSIRWQNGLLYHSDHKIDNNSISSGGSPLYADVTITTRKSAGTDSVHSGKGTANTEHKVSYISAEVDIEDIPSQDTYTQYSDETFDRETYPKHQNPVCIIYIGRK